MTHAPRLTGAALLAEHGMTAEPEAPASELRFPDGAHYRIEIPSCEGPEVLRGIVEEAGAWRIGALTTSTGYRRAAAPCCSHRPSWPRWPG